MDGEGCISIVSQNGKIKRIEVGLFQSEKQDAVLYTIHHFLKGHDVDCYWKRHTSDRSERATATTHLCVTKQKSVTRLLEGVVPYLIVKRRKAEEALFLLTEKERLGIPLTHMKVAAE
jgi:hypothetical protein